MIQINESIQVLEHQTLPISAEVIGIKRKDHSIIIDCGTTSQAIEFIHSFSEPRTFILTTWHPDHSFNEGCVLCDKRYVSSTCQKQFYKGEAITEKTEIEEGIILYPIRSCNDQNMLVVQVDDILFLQDALYKSGTGKYGKKHYESRDTDRTSTFKNEELEKALSKILKDKNLDDDMMKKVRSFVGNESPLTYSSPTKIVNGYDMSIVNALKEFILSSSAKKFCISHDVNFIYTKTGILKRFMELIQE